MCTNETIYPETVRILYRENRILYRLRDPPNLRQVVNVEDLSLSNSGDADIISEPDDGASGTEDDAINPINGQDDADMPATGLQNKYIFHVESRACSTVDNCCILY